MKNIFISIIKRGLLWAAVLSLAGCAFDLSFVKKLPASYTPAPGVTEDFVLSEAVTASLGTGYPTRLKSGTRWHAVGLTEHGLVFTTRDQIVTVEASNIYEARPVVTEQRLVGFYLPVEQKFVPIKHPIRIETQTVNHNLP